MKSVLVTVFLALASGSCAGPIRSSAPVVTPGGVRFAFVHPTAQSVAIAGSFNEWSVSSNPLARAKSPGSWTAIVALPPGEYLFMYVVNGTEWVTPPLAEDYVDDGFGSKNGVVVVRPAAR